jgi:DNA-binding transcriptional ArsR family regulator
MRPSCPVAASPVLGRPVPGRPAWIRPERPRSPDGSASSSRTSTAGSAPRTGRPTSLRADCVGAGIIVGNGPVRIGELAAQMAVSAPTVSQLIDALREQGLVTRDQDSRDRRVSRVGATPAGLALLEDLRRRATGLLAERSAGWPRTSGRHWPMPWPPGGGRVRPTGPVPRALIGVPVRGELTCGSNLWPRGAAEWSSGPWWSGSRRFPTLPHGACDFAVRCCICLEAMPGCSAMPSNRWPVLWRTASTAISPRRRSPSDHGDPLKRAPGKPRQRSIQTVTCSLSRRAEATTPRWRSHPISAYGSCDSHGRAEMGGTRGTCSWAANGGG